MMTLHLDAAWIGISLGLLSGTVQGLFFHREGWLGGYGSWRRRMLRLGHISFFGIAVLNLALAQTIYLRGGMSGLVVSSIGLVAGAVAMPLVCYFSAWRAGFRHLFFIPVVSLLAAAGGVVLGGLAA